MWVNRACADANAIAIQRITNRLPIGLLDSSDHFERLHACGRDIVFKTVPQRCDSLVELRRDQLTSTRLHFPDCGLKIGEPQGNTFVQFSLMSPQGMPGRPSPVAKDGVALVNADAVVFCNEADQPLGVWRHRGCTIVQFPNMTVSNSLNISRWTFELPLSGHVIEKAAS